MKKLLNLLRDPLIDSINIHWPGRGGDLNYANSSHDASFVS